MRKTEKEELLKEFYKKRRTLDKLEYEIDVLTKNNEEMKKIMETDFKSNAISKRIEKNNNMILNKSLQASDIRTETAAAEFIISSLPEEERTIIEMRYKHGRDYQFIVKELSMSKSTISRRISNVANILEEELSL